MSRRGDGIEARFQSACPRCGEDILPRQRVVLHRGTYLHVGCFGGGDEGGADALLLAVWALMILAGVAFWAAVVFVAVHFIAKAW